MELPTNSRISTIKDHNEITYNIPLIHRKNSIIRYACGAILFFLLFLGIPFQLDMSIKTKTIYFSFCLVILLLDTALITWMIYGKELIKLGDGFIEIYNVCFGIVFKRRYKLDLVNDVRINIKYKPIYNMKVSIFNIPELLGYNRGFVTFKYKNGTVEFGSSLSVEEAHCFVEEISRKKLSKR